MAIIFYLVGAVIMAFSAYVGVTAMQESPATDFGSGLFFALQGGVLSIAIGGAIVGLMLIGFGRALDLLGQIERHARMSAQIAVRSMPPGR